MISQVALVDRRCQLLRKTENLQLSALEAILAVASGSERSAGTVSYRLPASSGSTEYLFVLGRIAGCEGRGELLVLGSPADPAGKMGRLGTGSWPGIHPDSSGNGLGLAIVRSIAELFEGQVSVESRPGAGTIFTIQF